MEIPKTWLIFALVVTALGLFVFLGGPTWFQNLLRPRETVILPSSPNDPTTPGRELTIVTLLGRDGIPAIFDPLFRSPAETDNYRPDEPVLGISINGDNRVYSIPFLSGREIVNDTVGGVPVAVTW